MKVRDLVRFAGTVRVPAWPPPVWTTATGSPIPGEVLPMRGEGVLVSVMLLEASTLLRLAMRFDAREYTGLLSWNAPPSLTVVEHLLSANLGRKIQAIGDLDLVERDLAG